MTGFSDWVDRTRRGYDVARDPCSVDIDCGHLDCIPQVCGEAGYQQDGAGMGLEPR